VTAACDFFTVPTLTFKTLFCFVVLSHDRRRIVHINVTDHPTADWTLRQIVKAHPGNQPTPRFRIRDRDSTYAPEFRRQVKAMGVEEVITGTKCPWQNPYCERVIGSIRRECTDHIIPLGQRHLLRTVIAYQTSTTVREPTCRGSATLPSRRRSKRPDASYRSACSAEFIIDTGEWRDSRVCFEYSSYKMELRGFSGGTVHFHSHGRK
jgi:hypothetical protein